MSDDVILIDEPAPRVRRITMNRPEKRNALNHALRGGILETLREPTPIPRCRVHDHARCGHVASPRATTSAAATKACDMPYYTPGGDGQWPRHVTEGWMSIWDLAKPVIAQVHGYCLAGGSELATGCDLVYMAEDAQIGYPAVRFGVPDMHFHAWFVGMRKAMEMMLTGDSISGVEAAQLGWANAAFPAEELEARGARGRAAHRARAARARCSSTSAWSTARWRSWACAPASAPARSCARSGRTQKSMHEFVEGDAREGAHEGAPAARRAVRRLPHGK